MNIFATSPCPKECAKYLDDKRVVKMILETVQMLCCALNERAGYQIAPYKSTHKNHPCNKWARQDLDKFMWLYRHALALGEEYKSRYNKQHKSIDALRSIDMRTIYGLFETNYFEHPYRFVNCARNNELNIDYTLIKDVHLAYRKYLSDRWRTDKRAPTWYGQKRCFYSQNNTNFVDL